jgi:hypothetical protein
MAESQELTCNALFFLDKFLRHANLFVVADMLTSPEKSLITTYLKQLAELNSQRSQLESQMVRIETSIRSILALSDDEYEVVPFLERLDEITKPEGFTDAIRKVLRMSNEALTAGEIRDRLPQVGFALESYSNPLASIHTILKRLAKTEAFAQVEKGDKGAYVYMGVPVPPKK